MPRRNPLLFKPQEYKYLHRIFLKQESRAKLFVIIQEKKGVGLEQTEIDYVKQKFEEWSTENPNALLWLQK